MPELFKRNKRYYPPIEPRPCYRRSNNFNKLPQTVEKENSTAEVNFSKQMWYGNWNNGDRIAFLGVIVNVALAVATYMLYNLSVGATDSAKIAAEAAKKSADLQKVAWDSTKKYQKQIDVSDIRKENRDISTFNLQKRSLNAQITALNQSKLFFEKANEPSLQIGDFGDCIISDGQYPSLDFKIYSIDKSIGKGISYGIGIRFVDALDYIMFIKNPFDKTMDTIETGEYFTQEQYAPLKQYKGNFVLPNGFTNAYLENKCFLFFLGRYKYYNTITNKIKMYSFVYKITYDQKTKKAYYSPIINENNYIR